MILHFYNVDKEYVKYLQKVEREHRGFTKVPNMEYGAGHEDKFVCGIVLDINGFKYYVPVSSYKKQQNNNILIKLKDKYNPVKGSLRFNYMFPISDEYVTMRDFSKEKTESRKLFLHRQAVYCDSIRDDIYNKALETYNDVNNSNDKNLVQNSCDFKLLEQKCKEYELSKKTEQETKEQSAAVTEVENENNPDKK